MIYFIRPVGQPGPIKIGCSAIPRNRLQGLMAWSPLPLEIVAAVPGGFDLEWRIHHHLAAGHSHNEWFRSTPEVVAFVESVIAGAPVSSLIDLTKPLPARPRRKIHQTDNRRLCLSYRARLRLAYAPKGGRAANKHAPLDVEKILSRWSGSGELATPSPEEFGRIEQVLADPVSHGLTAAEKWPGLVAA